MNGVHMNGIKPKRRPIRFAVPSSGLMSLCIVPEFVRFLLKARRRGVRFDRTLTLGRQQSYVNPTKQKALGNEFGIPSADSEELTYGGFADAFFRDWLGALDTVSLDASDFEGATRIHDLNRPVPPEWHEGFDVVVDGGTLEHVFNFPVAMESCMRMLKAGGTMFGFMPANNYCGHGFYQFSPELLFRIFTKESGFRIEQLLLVTHPFPGGELSSRFSFYSVRDPVEIRSRVGCMNSVPTALWIEARRERCTDVLSPKPQQSDYGQAWRGAKAQPEIFFSAEDRRWAKVANRIVNRLVDSLSPGLRNWLAGQFQKHWHCNLRNRRFYQRLR